MAGSQQSDSENRFAASLSERAAQYRAETEKVVQEVGEHPLYELKRSCSLQQLSEKIEFVKDIQSIATSRIEIEKYLVIGADATRKKFHPVQNLKEFDEASLRQMLERYLTPVPDFEVFSSLIASDGSPFVLIVIPKQQSRRILARVSVNDETELKPMVLLRAGDLWTKGGSTGKRLAKPEDWDEIYEDVIGAETERRTRQRTAHALELAMAREKVQPGSSTSTVPSFYTDEEFQALMEDLCAVQDVARFKVLLERLRDDLVEGWHEVGAYEQPAELLPDPAELRMKVGENITNVFRPAVHWLTLAGLYTVKNDGPVAFVDAVVDLLQEVFETSHRLLMVHTFTPRVGATSNSDDYLSPTRPALESLVSLYLIGAYLAKRNRFRYFKSLLRPEVYRAGPVREREARKTLMVFWPLGAGYGEPDELRFRAGKINYCVKRIESDSAYLRLFGSATAATAAMCQFEFCLELNSYVANQSDHTSPIMVLT